MKALSKQTRSIKPAEVEKNWHIIDADGLVVGRVASLIANILRGKTKPTYTPHIDCGDNIIVVNLQRNSGKSAALDAGFRLAKGDIIVTLDADLQDDPAEIPRFIAEIDKGGDLVSGWKQHRLDPLGKTLPSKLFNVFTRRVSGLSLHDFNCGFKAYRRAVVADRRLDGGDHLQRGHVDHRHRVVGQVARVDEAAVGRERGAVGVAGVGGLRLALAGRLGGRRPLSPVPTAGSGSTHAIRHLPGTTLCPQLHVGPLAVQDDKQRTTVSSSGHGETRCRMDGGIAARSGQSGAAGHLGVGRHRSRSTRVSTTAGDRQGKTARYPGASSACAARTP